MEQSTSNRYPSLAFLEAGLGFNDQIHEMKCECIHCINNTKPLVLPKPPRMTSHRQKKLNNSQAYRSILKSLAEFNFVGNAKAADCILIDSSSLVYSSKSGKMRIKEGVTNLEVKRHFDELRRKGQSNLSFIGQVTGITNMALIQAPSSPQSMRQNKQIAVMAYKDGTEQLLTQNLLSKIFQKRKNDPFWEDISHILQIPPQIKHPIQKVKFHYQRTTQTLPVLTKIMQRLARQIDNVEQKSLTLQSSGNNHENRFLQEQQFEANPELKLSKPSSQKMSRQTSLSHSPKNRKNMSMEQSFQTIVNYENLIRQLQVSSMEIVSFLQLTSYLRVFNAQFQYFTDEKGTFYISNLSDVILQHLQSSDLTIMHDRYHPLQETGGEQVIKAKHYYEEIQKEQLWKICTAIVNQCLQIRKIQLKLADYNKPNNQILLKIFLKLFPSFKAEDIFRNINWKNQLPEITTDIRKKVNKIIREDEGIRILRRFNIHFRRTFH